MSERRWRVGAALLVAYAVVAIVTQGLSSRRARPLFDGFAPPAPYRWVKPPPEFIDNQPPQAAERTIPLGDVEAEAANASTTDAQIIVTLPQGTIVGHPPDTAVFLKITPLNAPSVAPLPASVRAVSNAYQVTLTYLPSQTPVTAVNPSSIIALTAASNSDGLHYLAPGAQQWQPVRSRAFGNTHGQTGGFQGSGHYVVTASPEVTNTTLPGIDPSGGSGGVVVALVAAAAVGGAVAGGFALRSRRQAAAKRTRQQRRQRARRRA